MTKHAKARAKATPAKTRAKAKPAKTRAKAKPAKTRAKARPKRAKAKGSTRRSPKTRLAAADIASRLVRAIPEPRCELRFSTPFGLLIATMLAAQSTDKAVNEVMPVLLERWPDAAALAQAVQADVEVVVLRTGFFRNKARAIRETSALLVEKHGGEVPHTMEELVALPGVARKTANVVLGSAYGLNLGFIVDTHVMRVSQRLRLTKQTEPARIEQDLCALFPQASWTDTAHRFTLHGRYTCLARKPACAACPLNELCPSREATPADDLAARETAEARRVYDALAYIRN